MTEIKTGVSRHFRGRPWLFPLGLLVLVAALTLANISGSSVGVYEISAGRSPTEADVIRGQVRPVRSDEWLVRTPWLMNQINNGLPKTTFSGVGSHDVSVVGDLPVRSLDILVRPHHITSWFLGPERALAAEWWMWHVLMICGVFSLIYVVTRMSGIAASCGLLLALSPSTQWWVAPGTFTTVGYGSLCGACFIAALGHSGRRRIGLAALGGWALACFVCTLYVPWMITTAIVVGVVTLGVGVEFVRNADDRSDALRRLIGVLVLVGAVGGVLTATFVLRHTEAMRAVNQTVYPGNRAAEVGGTLNPATIFGAPFDFYAYKPQTVSINGTNQSENSAGIAYLIPVMAAFFGLFAAGLRILSTRISAALFSAILAGGVLLAWALLPLPSYVGRIFLLDRVPPARLVPAIAFVSVVGMGLLAAHAGDRRNVLKSRIVFPSVLIFGVIQLWAAGLYRVEQAPVNPWRPMLVAILVCGAIAACLRGFTRFGFGALLVFGIVQFLHINPLQVGARPLLDNPVSALVKSVRSEMGLDAGWLTLGGDIYLRGSIEASGARFISGISRYPDHASWKILDPKAQYESAWNRYAHVAIEAGEIGSEPVISTPQSDVVIVKVDPCDARLRDLGVDVVATQNYELTGCGRLLGEAKWGDRVIRAYSIR